MSKELINYEDQQIIKTLKETVARGVTDFEFLWFLQQCKSTGLNPLKREIWCIPGSKYQKKNGEWVQGSAQISVGLNGYLAIANSHSQFDGMETNVTLGQDGKPISATCSVFRKDRSRPHTATVYFDEFYKEGNKVKNDDGTWSQKPSTWDKMPKVMIQKVAKAHALREAFPQELSGIYTEDEISNEEAIETTTIKIADKLPENQATVVYDLKEMDTDMLQNAEKILLAKKAKYDSDVNVWRSPARIKSLSAFEVTS